MKWPRLSARLLCLSHLTLLLKCLEEQEEESSVCPSKSIATIRCLSHARERGSEEYWCAREAHTAKAV